MLEIKQVPYIKQINRTDCGIACLLSIANFYGLSVPREWLYKESEYDKNGVSMYGIMKAAKKLGFQVEAKQGDISHLSLEKTPLIAHTHLKDNSKLFHFIVITELGKNKVKVMDPAIGCYKLSYLELENITTGHYLFLYKSTQLKSVTMKKSIQSISFKIFLSYKFAFVSLLCLIILELWLEFCTLFQFKILINVAMLVQSIMNTFSLGLLFFQFAFLKCIVRYTIGKYQLFLQYQSIRQAKSTFFTQFLTLPLQYYQLRESGTILNLIDDIDFVYKFQSSSIYLIFHHVLLLILLYFYVSYLSLWMVFILLCSHFIFTLYILCEKKNQRNLYEKMYNEKAKKNKLYVLLLNSIEMIKGLHLERVLKNRVYLQDKKFAVTNMNLEKRRQKQQAIFLFLESSIYLFVICSSIFLYINGHLSISLSTFILLEGFIVSILRSYNQLLSWYLEKQIYNEALERLNEFFNCYPETFMYHKQLVFLGEIFKINISNLSFSYGETLILNNINISILNKDKIFLYGNSGSGKSTLLKLLCRYLPVSYGMISINERDVVHYNLDTLRNMITYVHSNGTIMEGRLEDTILFHRKKDVERLEKVISICGIDKLLAEKGYSLDTYIEENGSNLSCGERQRLILAQGLYRNSNLYILDECLSMVDLEVEQEIIKKLITVYCDKIIIYVSHRTQHKKLFGRTFYMKEGKCYEEK